MLELILVFSLISSITIGGGYAMIPLIQKEAIYIHSWITQSDFLNILAISQITPGAIAINSATFIGYKSFGIAGGILASIGLIIPSTFFILLIAPILQKYEKNRFRKMIFTGIRPVVTGLIATSIILLAKTVYIFNDRISIVSIIITIFSLIALRLKTIHPIIVLTSCAIIGLIFGRFV